MLEDRLYLTIKRDGVEEDLHTGTLIMRTDYVHKCIRTHDTPRSESTNKRNVSTVKLALDVRGSHARIATLHDDFAPCTHGH